MSGTATQNRRRLVFPDAALAVGLALSVMLLASLGGRASGTPTPAASPAAAEAGVAYDTMIPDTDEGRARFGAIFIGTVIAVAGEDEVSTSDPEDSIPIILYDVEVERTLKGEAQGVVRVWYEGADDRSPDAEGARKLRQGERYLFFAGFNPDEGWYPVNASVGVIPIESDRQAEELVATFEPLIREAERSARQVAAEDPCERPSGPPAIAVEPRRGKAGDEVRLTGGPFARPEVAVWWDGRDALLDAAEVGTDCAIGTKVKIPKAEPGIHRIVVRDALGRKAEATIEVVAE